MPNDFLPSVAFVTPFCLLGLTTIAVVTRTGRKLAITRTFDWQDGKLNGPKYFFPLTKQLSGALSFLVASSQ